MSEKRMYQGNKQLRAERLLRGWSQKEVADHLGTATVTVNRWERGIQQPNAHLRLKLSALFGKSANDLGLLGEEVEIASAKEVNEKGEDKAAQAVIEEKPVQAVIEVGEGAKDRPQLFRQRRALLKWGSIGAATVAAGSGLTYWFTRPPSPLLYTYHAPAGAGVYDVEWSSQRNYLACVNGDYTVQVITALSGSYHPTLVGSAVNCLAWSPDGTQLASPGPDKTISIWDPINGVDALRFGYSDVRPESIAWSHNREKLAVSGIDGSIRLWNARTGVLLETYRSHIGPVWWVAWSPDDRYLASAGADGIVWLWNTTTGKTMLRYTGHAKAVLDVKWSRSGRWIVSASEDRTVHCWDVRTGKSRLIYRGHQASVQAAEWSPDERFIASAGADMSIQVWDVSTGAHNRTYEGHTNTVWTLSWCPDGTRFASSSADGTLRIWQVLL